MVKKFFGPFSPLTFLVILALVLPASAGSLTGVKIAIDPGHGGQTGINSGDPGAIGMNGLREADCVLAISLKLRDLLQAQGATVYLTRDKDVFVSLPARTNLANSLSADRLISVHQNANSNRSPNYTGSHVYLTASQKSIDLAGKSVAELEAYHNTGVVSTNINVRGVHADNFHMVRESTMPAELIENTFISNVNEEVRLRATSHLHSSAEAIFRGVMNHLGKVAPSDNAAPVISHSAIAQGQEGVALQVTATITDASGVSGATLFYRRKGNSVWTSVAMTKGAGEIYSATIPSTLVAPEGVEYYLESKDAVGNAGRNPSGSPVTPFSVSVVSVPKVGSLTGVISDAATGARLGGVAVSLSPGGTSVVTSATGVYRFDNLKAGQYTATAKLQGFADNAAAKAVEAGATWWNSFALSPLPKGPQPGDIVINELMWDQDEYIELYNRTNRDISIAGWRITAGTGATVDKTQVIIDNPMILKAGGYYVAADKNALPGITVDEVDAQTWAQSSQVVTIWTGNPLDAASVRIDQIGKAGGSWFAGINDTKGVAMERKSATGSGSDASAWQSSSATTGGRYGTATAANSPGRTVTVALLDAGRSLWRIASAGPSAQRLASTPAVAATPLTSLLVNVLVAAGSYDTSPELRVAIIGATTVSAGSRHTYIAKAYEGDKELASQSFTVTFGRGATATVSRALTVTPASKLRVTLTGNLDVSIERQAGSVALEVNNPAVAGGASDIEVSLASLIRNATESVKLAVYALDSRMVVDALKAAAANLGAENVQVVMEGANYANAVYGPFAKELEAAGITIIRDDQNAGDGDALMHNKFVVIDEQTVWMGSANMTNKDAYTNANNVLILRSADLAAAYGAEFDRMFAGQFGADKTDPIATRVTIKPPADVVDINTARVATLDKLPGISTELATAIVAERNKNGSFVVVEDLMKVAGMDAAIFNGIRSRVAVNVESTSAQAEVLFSPNTEIKQRILAAINGAQREIAFAIFTFTDDDIAAALTRAQARGVKVRGVADAWQALAEISQVAGLREGGMDVKKDGFSGLMHNKFLVVDASTVITGSTNWTNSAVNRNDENCLIVQSSSLAAKYMSAFEGYYTAGR